MAEETTQKAPEAGATPTSAPAPAAPAAAGGPGPGSGSGSGPGGGGHSGQGSGQGSGPGSGPGSGSGSGPGGGGPGSGGPGPRPGGRPGGGPGGRGKFFRRKKVCKFCTEKIDAIPYRDVRLLQQFVAERGKIVPRRLTGVCTTHQRRLTRAIKQARNIALLPFATRH